MIKSQIDMLLDDQTEDLKVDEYGSLSYTIAEDTPPHAVARRLGTPPGGYARMIRVGNGALVYDQSYSSELPLLLSLPDPLGADVQTAVTLASSQDGRLNVVDFIINTEGGAVNSFTLMYQLTDENVQAITVNV